MLESKTTLVADVLHGTITLSPLEKRLISTRIFNRLHNVLQNSTVYFTFPSNRTCRFSHSLGTTKIAGQMFRAALANATPEVRSQFLEEISVFQSNLRNDKRFSEEVNTHVSSATARSSVLAKNPPCLAGPFYQDALLPNLNEKHVDPYLIAFQALRFAALFHDLGHPPFSHVTEFALQRIFEELTDNHGTARRNKVYESLTQFLSDGDKGAFHELLGSQLTTRLLGILLDDLKQLRCADQDIYAVLVTAQCTKAILEDCPGPFSAMHEIVAGSLDADRLDYVQRDIMMSGLSREPFRAERLLNTYSLIPPESRTDRYRFVPSVRALNTLEDFFIQRFHLYKYVIHHHRVVKFDALMQRCVEQLSQKYFQAEPPGTPSVQSAQPVDDSMLATDISGLWQVFGQDVGTFKSLADRYYIQWDDAWLLTVLRNEYFALVARSGENPCSPSDSALRTQLEELLSNRKHYHVLYKRSESFRHVDSSFAKAMPKHFDWKKLARRLSSKQREGVPTAEVKLLVEYVSRIGKAINKPEETTRLVEAHGYLLSRIISIILQASPRSKDATIDFVDDAKDVLLKSLRRQGITDVLIIHRRIRPGVSRGFSLADSNGRLISLGRISRVADDLERAALLVPPFYVYLLCEFAPTEDQLSRWRIKLGNILWSSFATWVR